MTRWAAFLGGAALAMSAGPALAAPLSALDIFKQFNVVTFGNFTSSADVEGRALIGGNMTGGATFDLRPASAAASSFSALTVYGNETSGGSFNVLNGGGVAIGGSNAGNFSLTGGGNVTVGGSNSGTLNASSGSGAVVVGGGNSGVLTAGGGGSVFVGGNNTANLTVNGAGSATVLGSNAATVSLANGGSVYAGSNTGNGNINVNGASGTVALAGSNAGQLTLNAGGSVKIAGDTGNINMNGGAVTYTGNRTGNLNLNGGATATKVANAGVTAPATPSTALPAFSSVQAPLTALSSQLAGLAANSTVKVAGSSIAFNATPDLTGTAVFSVNTSLFSPNSTVSISVGSASSVIINVNVDSCSGTSCAYNFLSSVNFTNPTSYADDVVWNFVNATGLSFANEFGGSVLAPLAAVSNAGPIDGTLVANSFTGGGELHSYAYTGSFLTGGNSVPATVPEPGTLVLLGGGMAALWAFRRRRR